VAGTVYILLNT